MASNVSVSQESRLNSLWYSFVPHLKHAVAHSLTGVFMRAMAIPRQIILCRNPLTHVDSLTFGGEITHDRIDQDRVYYFQGDNNPPREKLHYIINHVNELAEQMGIHKTIRVFPNYYNPANLGAALGSSCSQEMVVYVGRNLPSSSNAVIDSVLAHELTHVKHDHMLKETVLRISILVLDILGAIFLSPLVIPLIEFFASPLESYNRRICEMDADETAMNTLNSNAGAIESFVNLMNLCRSLRSEGTPEERREREREISPSGDKRGDIFHPLLSDRIRKAQSFQPRVNNT